MVKKTILTLAIALSLSSCANKTKELEITTIKGFPTEEGLNKGLSALYSGVVDGDVLLIAGGCNFPDTPASEGGKKVFYDSVYASELSGDSLQWHKIGSLPHAAAYGATVQASANSLIFIGGSTCEGDIKDVIKLSYNGGTITLDTLASLPEKRSNHAASIVGSRVYVTGGAVNGVPSCSVLSLDLKEPNSSWQKEADMIGVPRTQCLSTALQSGEREYLYVFGGFAVAHANKAPSMSLTTLRYDPVTKIWSYAASAADTAGEPLSLGGGASVRLNNNQALFTGGVNKDLFLNALKREYSLSQAIEAGDETLVKELRQQGKDYLLQEPEWYKFNNKIMLYDASLDLWTELGTSPHTARAGASLVSVGEEAYVINGELKPGIRSPQITRLTNLY